MSFTSIFIGKPVMSAGRRPVSVGMSFLLPVIVCLFSSSCREYERQDILITNMQKDTSWLYKQIDPVITERQFNVRIEGELNGEATLEIQHRIFGVPVPEGRKRIITGYSVLPEGRFSFGYWDDSGSPRKFIFHPGKATKGYVRVFIRPGRLTRDSTWTELKQVAGRSGIFDRPDTDL